MPDDLDSLLSQRRNRRQAYYQKYGPTLSRQAEFDVFIGLMIASGVIKKDQFFDLVETFLTNEDDARRVAAGFRE